MTPESLYECWNCDRCSIKATLGELSNSIDAKRFLLQQLRERKSNLEIKASSGVQIDVLTGVNTTSTSSSSSSPSPTITSSSSSQSPNITSPSIFSTTSEINGGVKKRKKKKPRNNDGTPTVLPTAAATSSNNNIPGVVNYDSNNTIGNKLDTLDGLIEEYGNEIEKQASILREKEADFHLLQYALKYNVDRKLVN